MAPDYGIHNDIPEAIYRGWDLAHYSSLKVIAKSIEEYAYLKANPRQETAALRLGAATDCRILQPDLYDSLYIGMTEKIDKRTKAGKEAWAAFEEEAGNRTVLDIEQAGTVDAIHKALSQHSQASELLSGGKSQVAVVWKDGETRIDCKARIDYLKDGIAIDLKTTRDVEFDAFSRDVLNFGYNLQAAMYSDGLTVAGEDIEHYYIIAVQSHAPHRVKIYELDMNFMYLGRQGYRSALYILRRCRKTDNWRDPEMVEELVAPKWKLYQEGLLGED